MNSLGPEKALIFRITHVDNLPWILDHGLHCRNSGIFDPNYHEIGNPDLIDKRARRRVHIPPGGTLSDYIPFYFTPHSPMLLNIKTGWGDMRQTPMRDIILLVASLRKLAGQTHHFVFTDRHAYLQLAEYSNDLAHLDRIDWDIIRARDFRRDAEDPGKVERYQAEALIHEQLPVRALIGIACYGPSQVETVKAQVESRALRLQVVPRPDWYF